ncbi:hypothetical protein FPQ18DRAFT_78049 [Pyronema domesticum]|uniref:Similar to E3 ubiquitin-protein ligase RNF167 acc. no. Q91XF4 n=1 Tax=Pyronema omphalodes (strain CBS 100304) TaxID=1076935 RepID=U4KXK9_PYROM|nr:hypothetical protein FPQ18DRAFT_78049 [Pyronema domesticum]CCX06897.1 Similar to E3 ubiquitin-protein ligase RNF167; acc. no. Q91XF4 [Pyronema omphalodes CBS 100304]
MPPRLKQFLLLLVMFTTGTAIIYLCLFVGIYPPKSQATQSLLFPASAVISLTDDNSTFFISRPAAFGPPLPKNGMDGELFVLEEGQLACDDTPGWDPSAALDINNIPLLPEGEDDGTDNILNPNVPSDVVKSTGSYHADIESLQQSAEIEGKIVLVARGGCGFLEKVLWAQRRGGIALIVGDYKRPGVGGGSTALVTMYAKGDTSNVSIPSIFTSHTTAALLTTLLPKLYRPSLTSSRIPAAIPNSPTTTAASIPAINGPHYNLDGTPVRPPATAATTIPSAIPSKIIHIPPAERTGLWITLTPTTMTSSPFFDTLLVLVVSPLVTLTVVYTLLLIRSRIRRRRWRAPKSIVERLPVRTYQSMSTTPPVAVATAFPPRSSSLPNPAQQQEQLLERSNTVEPQQRFHSRWSGCSECVVCLEDYVDGVSKVMKLPCGHEFHVDCITPWLTTRRRTCPICKGDVVRGVRAIAEGSIDGSDETTPLVLGDEEEEDGWDGQRHDLEGGHNNHHGRS